MLHLLGHIVVWSSPVHGNQLPILAKIKCSLNLVAFLWQFVSNRDIGSFIHCMPVVLGQTVACVWVIWVCCIWDCKYCCQIIFSECWHTVCQMANTHLLDVCICIVCPGGVVFGIGHLIGSWSLTAQGYMLDRLGSVTSIVSFCQLSGGCITKQICIHICMLCIEFCQTYKVCNYWICIVFEWFFVCVLFLSLFCVYKISYRIFL